jgi:hypothetical protein
MENEMLACLDKLVFIFLGGKVLEDENNTLRGNFRIRLPIGTASYPRRNVSLLSSFLFPFSAKI